MKKEIFIRRCIVGFGLLVVSVFFLVVIFGDKEKNITAGKETLSKKSKKIAEPKAKQDEIKKIIDEVTKKNIVTNSAKLAVKKKKLNDTTLNFKKSWSYNGAVVGNNLPIANVSQIPSGILVEPETGKILWSKLSNKPMEIASMTKMMTVLLAFEAIDKGEISLNDRLYVSKATARIGGSQVYLDPKENFTLAEILKTIMIVSANDSAYLVAEKLGNGNVDAFVKQMNEKAKEFGMKSTHFYNPHGLPEKGSKDNKSSAYDLAILACELLKYPLVMKWADTWTDDFRDGKFKLVNHNKLVKTVKGVDGMKTGYYRQAGFCVTVTAKRNGRRFIEVIIGAKTKKLRNGFAAKLLDWAEKQ